MEDSDSDDSYYYPQREAHRESVLEAHRPSYVSMCVFSFVIGRFSLLTLVSLFLFGYYLTE